MKRFIDLANHSGCSKKMGACMLDGFLNTLSTGDSAEAIKLLLKDKPDAGIFPFRGVQLASTVDIVYPSALSPADFGTIAVNHVLNDIYAVGAKPLIALSILGLPKGVEGTDERIVRMMQAAITNLHSSGSTLMGGHTLVEQEDLMFGFSVIGFRDCPTDSQSVGQDDVIVLNKPLGTSVGIGLWKMYPEASTKYQDVLEGMLRSNERLSECLGRFGINAVTDVSGYGFLGHLINVLKRYNVSAEIITSACPIYNSVATIPSSDQPTSRQFSGNWEYCEAYTLQLKHIAPQLHAFLLDAQISGGLIFICSPEVLGKIRTLHPSEDLFEIGRVNNGAAGTVAFL